MGTFRYWVEEEDEFKRKLRFPGKGPRWDFDYSGVEFDLVKEWFPVFHSNGQNPRREIVKWWRLTYPERVENGKFYSKLMGSIEWWEKHTDFSKFDEGKHYQVKVEVRTKRT